MLYNPQNWYWLASDGRVYSSARMAVVAAQDAGYTAWTRSGYVPTPWPKDVSGNQTPASLQDVLTPYGLFYSPASALVAAASAACAAINSQIVPDQTHWYAYLLSAAMVGPGAVVPTSGPIAVSFALNASSFGFQPQAFATLIVNVTEAAQLLSAALATLEAGAATASTPAQLASDLAAFENSIASIVASLNSAGLTVTVTAPAAILIPGINA